MKQCLPRAYAVIMRAVGIVAIAIPLSLTACVSDPVGGRQSRTTNEGPDLRPPEPITAAQRASLLDPSNFADGRRVALVIGNSKYSGGISRLANPANDANDVAAALKRVGFEVDLELDASRDQMKRAVLKFSQRLKEGDVGLFYYAGHAVQVDGRNFMIPIGADLETSDARPDTLADYVGLETLEIDDVLGRMANAEPDVSIVIFDACRDNPFAQSTRSVTRGLAPPNLSPRGTLISYATAPGDVAEDGNTKNSPYTSALVKKIQTPGLHLEGVFKEVRREVVAVTDGRQTPWENSSVIGDFYFIPPAPESPVFEPAPVATRPAPAPEPSPKPITKPVEPTLPETLASPVQVPKETPKKETAASKVAPKSNSRFNTVIITP